MNRIFMILLLIICTFSASYGQQRPPRQQIPPTGQISLSSSMPFFRAIEILSEISARLENKVIIDEKIRTDSISVEIVDMVWRDALNLILRINDLEYEEFPVYIKILDRIEEVAVEEEKKYDSSMREVNISAIFFEGDKHALSERGINWSAWIRADIPFLEIEDLIIELQQNLVGEKSAQDIFSASITHETTDQILMGLLKALETEAVGEILATPNIQVLEGEEGLVQVGQDFSIKTFDFAGNITDVFISTGIILKVKPLVIQEDSLYFIHLDVEAERSSVSPGQITTIINKTNANTSLFLLDGERAAIAGLYSTDESMERYGIPILKDLPWWFFGIRYLFGYDRKEITEKELIIILKAELVPTLQDREISQLHNIDFLNQRLEELKNRIKK